MFLSRVIISQSGDDFQSQHPKSLVILWSSKLLSALPLSVAVCELKTQAHAYTQLFIVPGRSGRRQVNSKSELCFSSAMHFFFFLTSIKKNDQVMENASFLRRLYYTATLRSLCLCMLFTFVMVMTASNRKQRKWV